MDRLPWLIVELGKALSGPVLTAPTDAERTVVVALYDALGVLFLQRALIPVDSVEMSWLAARAKYLVKHAEGTIGKEWKRVTPWAATVLDTALGLKVQPSRWG